MSQSLIAKIESGKIDPAYSKARKILETLRNMLRKSETSVKSLMNAKIISISPAANVKEAVAIMRKHSFSQLPVIEGEIAIGLVSEMSILDAIMDGKSHLAVKDVMEDAPPLVSKEASSQVVFDLLKFYPMVIVQERGKLRGIITKSDIIKNLFKG